MSVCRVCLTGGEVKLYSGIHARLTEIYEKLSDSKFNSNDGRSRVVCCFCYQRLLRCCALSEMAHRSEKALNDLALEGLEGVLGLPQFYRVLGMFADARLDGSSALIQKHTPSSLAHFQATHETIEVRNLGTEQCLSATPLQIFEVRGKTSKKVSMMTVKDEPISAVHRVEEEQQVTEPALSLECTEQVNNWFSFEDSNEEMETELIAQDPVMKVKKSPEKAKAKHECVICGRLFNKAFLLQLHIKVHMKIYTCTICGEEFIQSHELLAHMIQHTRAQKYSCNLCNRQCSKEETLKRHMRVHMDDKPSFTCGMCKIQCGNTWNLNKHMEIHKWCK